MSFGGAFIDNQYLVDESYGRKILVNKNIDKFSFILPSDPFHECHRALCSEDGQCDSCILAL